MIGIDVDDRDALRSLDDLQRRLKQIDGEHEIPSEELFPPHFMKKYTDTDSIEEFIRNTGMIPQEEETITKEMFEAIPDDEFDEYVNDHSVFDSWQNMVNIAGKEWTARQLGL